MRRKVVIVPVVVLIVAAAGLWWLVAGGRVQLEAMLKDQGGAAGLGVLELSANVEVREMNLAFSVPGRIKKMLLSEGDRVPRGQVVAELDPAYYRDALDRAEALLEVRRAALEKARRGARVEEIEKVRAQVRGARAVVENAQTTYERMRSLYEKGAVTKETLDRATMALKRARARLSGAQAALRLVRKGARTEDIRQAEAMVHEAEVQVRGAKRRLDDTRLVAPVDGVVQTRVHEVGEVVRQGEPVYSVILNSPVYIRGYVNERELDSLHAGMAVTVRTDGGYTCAGKLAFISPRAQFTPKMVQTREIRTDLVYRIRVVVTGTCRKADGTAGKAETVLKQGMPVTVLVDVRGGTSDATRGG